MGKIAFIFPGQGAQYPGMGKDLYDNVPVAAAVFQRLDTVRPGTAVQCFRGSTEELTQTCNTQPCMFAVELAAAAALTAAGISCDLAAGFSLGEIAALTHVQAVSLEDGFSLVSKRGQLMQDAAEQVDSGMVAVIKLDAEKVEQLCARYEHVYPVNYNCPGQISVAGLKAELTPFCQDVKSAGGRGIPLKVKGAFHSPLMATAAQSFAAVVANYQFKNAKSTLYSNFTGLPYEQDYDALLTQQICNPVRWQALVEHMLAQGADTFIELGPGSTLCGLIKKINTNVRVLHVEDCASLNETIKEVTSC